MLLPLLRRVKISFKENSLIIKLEPEDKNNKTQNIIKISNINQISENEIEELLKILKRDVKIKNYSVKIGQDEKID